jgi:haloalkane dehalogenase
MALLRTPEERFVDIPDFDYEPRYVEVGTHEGEPLRMAYVEAGPPSAPPVLMLHGEPTWSFLYRKMIPLVASGGLRAIAPDFVGFGRSDKLSQRGDYSYQTHVDWVHAFVQSLDLTGITLFGQDWGGLIGLRVLAESPERFAGAVASNTFLPTGDRPLGEPFEQWRNFSQTTVEFPVGDFVQFGTVSELSDDVVAAYNAPFPEEPYKAAARQFPMLVPTDPNDPAAGANRRAWDVLSKWEKPFLTAFSDSDPMTRKADGVLQKLIPGARGQNHVTLENAGHFIQEDKGEELGELLAAFARQT